MGNFLAGIIDHGNEIALTDHTRLLRPNPVGDEVSMVPGFIVIRALMTKDVMRGELAG